jgi:hypothetical protein
MNIEKHETKLVGSWIFNGKNIEKNDVCKRIEWLASNYLNKVSADASGWDILYQDMNDGRYWELIYPTSEMHGGGPPSLINLSVEDARKKYHFT